MMLDTAEGLCHVILSWSCKIRILLSVYYECQSMLDNYFCDDPSLIMKYVQPWNTVHHKYR